MLWVRRRKDALLCPCVETETCVGCDEPIMPGYDASVKTVLVATAALGGLGLTEAPGVTRVVVLRPWFGHGWA